jgi:hypothetical protein
VKHRLAFNRRDLAEPKREPCGFYARLSVKPEKQVGWQPRSSAPITHQRCPTSSSPAGNPDDAAQVCGEAGTTCCLAIAEAPGLFRTRGNGRRRAEFSVAAKDLRCGPERLITGQKLADNPIVDWGCRYRSKRKPRLRARVADVNMAEDCGLVQDDVSTPRPRAHSPRRIRNGEFGPRKQEDRCLQIFRRREASRARSKIANS